MITITYENVMAFLAFFTASCVAGGWVLKIIKGFKKPSDDIRANLSAHDKMLNNDTRRINELESQFRFVLKAISLLLQDDLVILNHLRTDNNTGEMASQESKVQEFLIKRE